MYTMRSIHDYGDKTSFVSTSTMYSVKNIHANDDDNLAKPTIENDVSLSQNDATVTKLQLRQERILLQLEELKLQLQSIRKNNQESPNVASAAATVSSSATGKTVKLDKMQDVVIAANPQRPPLSLLVLLNMLRERIVVGTNVHVHSSVKEDTAKLLEFFRKRDGSRSDVQMMITLIWKNAEGIDPVMMVKPTAQSPIRGEVNIARYFSHLLGPRDEAVRSTLVDGMLDTIHGSVLHGSNKETQSAMRQLNAKLGKSKWLASQDAPTAVDAVTWSILRRADLPADSQSNVAKWLAACDAHEFFGDALAYIS